MKKWSCVIPIIMIIAITFVQVSCSSLEKVQPYEGIAQPRSAVNITTSIGFVRIVLFDEEAPKNVENFRVLIDRRFYHGLVINRVVRDELIQAGDPSGDGSGNSGVFVKLETHPALTNIPYTVGMAHPADEPDQASSQFYIVMKENPRLDGKYTVIGHVVEGQSVIDSLHFGDTLVDLETDKANENDWKLLQKDIEKWNKDKETEAFNERNKK